VKSILSTLIFRFLLLITNFGAAILLARHLTLGERGVISGIITGVTVFSSILSSLQIERILKHGTSIYQEVKGTTIWVLIIGACSSAWLQQRYDLNYEVYFLVFFNFSLTYINALFVNSIFKFQSIFIANCIYFAYSFLILASLIGLVLAQSLNIFSYLLLASLIELFILCLSLLVHHLCKRHIEVLKSRVTFESSKMSWFAAFLESNSVALMIFCFSLLASPNFIALLTLTLSLLSPYLLLLTVLTPFLLNLDFRLGAFVNRHRGFSSLMRFNLVCIIFFTGSYLYFIFLSSVTTKFLGEQYIQLQDSSALICTVGVFLSADKISMLLLRRFSEDLISLSINLFRYSSFVVLGFLCSQLSPPFNIILLGFLLISILVCFTNILFLGLKYRRKGYVSE